MNYENQTQDELIQKIKDLEAENRSLRGHGLGRERKLVLPLEIMEKYRYQYCEPHSIVDGVLYDDGLRYFPDSSSLNKLSLLVRETCFEKQRKEKRYRRGFHDNVTIGDYAIAMVDMSEEQYGRYLKIMQEVLDVLYKYRFIKPPLPAKKGGQHG